MKAFGYVRLSKWDETTTSPQRQRQAIARLCKDRGWKLAEVFEDIDVSAYNGNHRPAFEAMMSRLSEVDAIVFWTLDRLTRSSVQAGQVAEACKAAKVDLVATDMNIDTTSAGGRFVYDVLAAKGQMESATTGERSRAMVAYKHERGEPLGQVPYGWRKVGKALEIDPKAQAVLRDAAERYVGGESLNAIGKTLPLAPGSINRMLQSERVQEALPDELREELVLALAERRGQTVPSRRQSLLGGIARCAVCGRGLKAGSQRVRSSGPWHSYICRMPGHVTMSGRWLDASVSEQVLSAIDPDKLVAAVKERRKAGQTRGAVAIEARIADVEDMFTEGKLSRSSFERMRASLVEKLAAAKKADAGNHVPSLDLDLARNLRRLWPDLTIPERRRVIQAVVKTLTIAKTRAIGGKPIDPKRVSVVWR
jgi:site-specific DNA recombinase